MNAYRITDSVGTEFVVMARGVAAAMTTAAQIAEEYGDSRSIASASLI